MSRQIREPFGAEKRDFPCETHGACGPDHERRTYRRARLAGRAGDPVRLFNLLLTRAGPVFPGSSNARIRLCRFPPSLQSRDRRSRRTRRSRRSQRSRPCVARRPPRAVKKAPRPRRLPALRESAVRVRRARAVRTPFWRRWPNCRLAAEAPARAARIAGLASPRRAARSTPPGRRSPARDWLGWRASGP